MINRRQLLKATLSAPALLSLKGCQLIPSKPSAEVLIIGGGFAGVTAAKYIRLLDQRIRVTLIEPKKVYQACPTSNWLFGGVQSPGATRFSYQPACDRYGIQMIHQSAESINPETQQVMLADGHQLRYDRIIVAPGIDFHWNDIAGYNRQTAEFIPHAWQAGSQTQTLLQQIQQMPNGGVVAICPPNNPYRCPPGPYERASMMAYYLKKHKPRSKILILDPKSRFSKQDLFIAGWRQHFGYETDNSLIEWIPIPDNPIISLAAKSRTVETDFGDRFQAHVLNIIPRQKAAKIVHTCGLTDNSGWCPVDPKSHASTRHQNIHIIGDAANYAPIPKSAFAANSEAKVCAQAVVNLLNDQPVLTPNWINACYSLITPQHGISIAKVYKLNQHNQIEGVEASGGVTSSESPEIFAAESKYARHWFHSIVQDSFI